MRLHLHLLSDSTGETLENIAKAALAQFDDVETLRHFYVQSVENAVAFLDGAPVRVTNPQVLGR